MRGSRRFGGRAATYRRLRVKLMQVGGVSNGRMSSAHRECDQTLLKTIGHPELVEGSVLSFSMGFPRFDGQQGKGFGLVVEFRG
jgi:hypothetical protein